MTQRATLFGMQIDRLNMGQAVATIQEWLGQSSAGCRYVVTPNVDHAVMFQEHAGLRAAYAEAGLVLADGMPVVLAAKLLRRGLPERVTGSDLVPALFQAADQREGLTAYLLGAAPGVAERAAVEIQRRWPRIRVVGTYSPPLGFENDPVENDAILARIAEAKPELLVVGLGAPKQELWVHRHAGQIQARVALCVGATIDFLAQEKRRAPMWMRRCGIEWLHRVVSEPRRLFKRYLRDALLFPRLLLREVLGRRASA